MQKQIISHVNRTLYLKIEISFEQLKSSMQLDTKAITFL